MIADSITLTNVAVADQIYDLISREGMNSVRRHTTASSALQKAVNIKHTLDLKAKTKPNRHLVAVTAATQDADGNDLAYSAHVVITRHKQATDADVTDAVAELVSFLSVPANIAQLLIGGN